MKLTPIAYSFVLGLTSLLFLFSCNKRYEDDPFTTRFISLNKRLTGKWEIHTFRVEDVDSSSVLQVDSLSIFTHYDFKPLDRYLKGKIERLETYNKTKSLGGILIYGIFSLEKKDHIQFGAYQITDTALISQGYMKRYGPLNNFSISWNIKSLTKKNLYLITFYKGKKYELYFKKEN